jgi:hypothetical protein
MSRESSVLLTGATGYVGGRLLPALEAAGHRVRCLARRPEFLARRVGPDTEVVANDCLVPESLDAAMQGIEVAYYLVHSMGSSGDFEDLDRRAAAGFAAAAHRAGVRRIIYPGGLGASRERLSPHLRSRQQTGEALRAAGVPVVELRASIILGSGSLSFELIRALVERLPVMICPRWVQVQAQPIAIEDVVTRDDALQRFDVRPMDLRAAIDRTMHNEDRRLAMTRWSDAISSGGHPRSWGGSSAAGWSTRARRASRCRRHRPPRPSASSADSAAGTTPAGGGACAASSTSWSAASACGAAVVIPTSSRSTTRSTSGASRPSSPIVACAWWPR